MRLDVLLPPPQELLLERLGVLGEHLAAALRGVCPRHFLLQIAHPT